MKNKKYHTVGPIPKSNIKIVERGQIDTLAQKYMTVHYSGLVLAPKQGGGGGGVKLVFQAQNSRLSEMMRSCRYVPFRPK